MSATRVGGSSAAPAASPTTEPTTAPAAEPVVVRLARPASAPTAPRALLLHGLASGGYVWAPFLARAAGDWELWTAELPWRGDGVADWAEHADLARWLDDAVDALPTPPDVVLAHSFSAGVLLEHLAADPPPAWRPRGVGLVSPFYRRRSADFDWTAISYYLNEFHRILAEGIRVRSGGRLDPSTQDEMARHVRAFVGPYGWVRFFETYLRTPSLRLDRVGVPCLVLAGADDVAAFPRDSRALAEALLNARLHVLPGCGHFAMADRADAFAEHVNAFLDEIAVQPARPGDTHMSLTSSPTTPATATDGLLTTSTVVAVRARYEGSNICTWIGFKHVNYLVEEAVLAHFSACGLPARELYEEYALGVDLVGLDTRIRTALHMDDMATAEVTPSTTPGAGELAFAVTLTVERDGEPTRAVSAKVRVVLRSDPASGPATPAPDALTPFVVDRIGDPATGAAPGGPAPAGTDGRGDSGADDVLDRLRAGRNAFVWKYRMPYIYCHFTDRVQMSGYLRQMEEVVDLFLADRGISIKSLLDDRRWIPVVPHSRIDLLGEAKMEEELYTVYTVEDIFKDFTYTSRMDCYVVRDGELVRTATGTITHGYAVIENRRDWSLVNFDQRVLDALAGTRA